jgi:tyrosinase
MAATFSTPLGFRLQGNKEFLMIHVSRRSFLSAAGSIPFAAWLESHAYGYNAAPKVRYECRTSQGIDMLKSYAAGVKAMRNLPDSDPRSWVFQWYTHEVRGDMTKDAGINQTFTNPADPNRAVAQAMWNTCQAHNPGDDEDYFLPWHRCFVLFFEQIIAQLSGQPDFALPYWNYSTDVQTDRGVIPPQFTLPNDPVFGSLFDELRNPGVNQGTPIQNTAVGQEIAQGGVDPLSLDALTDTTYGTNGADAGFNADLDNGLHGNVHVMIGGQQNMGAIPWAARDPIFWMHHCNIDRLWGSWNTAGGVNPTLSQTFTFVDGTGTKVVVDIKDFLDLSVLNYTYDRFEPVPAFPTPTPTVAPPTPVPIAATPPQPLSLSATAARAALEPAPSQPSLPRAIAAHISARVPKHVYVVLRQLKADAQPGVLYRAYLDLPDNPTPQQLADHYVGTINFFNFVQHGDAHAAAAAPRAPGRSKERFVSFEVTSKIRALNSNRAIREKPVITIIPVGKPAENAHPVIGKVELVVQ